MRIKFFLVRALKFGQAVESEADSMLQRYLHWVQIELGLHNRFWPLQLRATPISGLGLNRPKKSLK